MVEIAGGYTPGRAWGSHSGFGDMGWDPGSGGIGSMFGFLRRQQQMRDRMAQAQLDLIAEQINASRAGRAQDAQRMTMAKQMAKREDAWRQYQDWSKGDQAMAMGWGLTRGMAMPRNVPGNVAAAGGGDPAAMHQGMMQSGRLLGALGGQALAGAQPLPEPPEQFATGPGQRGFSATGMRAGNLPPPTYGAGVNTSIFGGPNPIQGVPIPDPGNVDPANVYGGVGGLEYAPWSQQNMGYPQQEEGTLPGTVQETGLAEIHEGEAIIPDEQVDEPLLKYLRRDAMKKGVPLGQGTTKGYKCGTLKYAGGSLGEGFDPAAFAAYFAAGNDPVQRAELAKRGLITSPTPKIPGVSSIYTPSAPSPYANYTGPQMKQLSKKIEKELGEEGIKAISKSPKGRGFLKALGIGAGVIAAATTAGTGAAKAKKVEPWMYLDLMSYPYIAAREAMAQKEAAPGAEGAELAAKTTTGLVGGAGESLLDWTGPYARGLGLEEPSQARVEIPDISGKGLGIEGGVPPAGPPTGLPEGGLEAALARTGAGDFGTPEQPLELEGQPEGAIPQSMEDLRGLPENINARHKSQMNMVQAESILDHLQFHGHELDPQQYQMLMDQVKQKMTLGQLYGKSMDQREKFMNESVAAGQKLQEALTKIQVQQQAMGQRQLSVEERKQQGRKELAYVREEVQQLGNLIETSVGGTSRERADAKDLIASILQQAARIKGGAEMSDAEALNFVDELINMPKEEQLMLVTDLQNLMMNVGR